MKKLAFFVSADTDRYFQKTAINSPRNALESKTAFWKYCWRHVTPHSTLFLSFQADALHFNSTSYFHTTSLNPVIIYI